MKKYIVLFLFFLLLFANSCVKDEAIYYVTDNIIEYNGQKYIQYVNNDFFLPFLNDHSPYDCEATSIYKSFVKAKEDKNAFFIYDEFVLENICFLLDGVQIPDSIVEINHIDKIICIKKNESITTITDEQKIENILNYFISKTDSKTSKESDIIVYAISSYYGGSFCLTYNQAIIKDANEYYLATENGLELVPQELFRDN